MIEVLHEELPVDTHRVTPSIDTHRVTPSHPVSKIPSRMKMRSLNDSIAIMLRSYTRAINIQEKRTGALFQQGTKSICLNTHELSPAYYDTSFGIVGNCSFPELEYPGICFHYIHQNPVRFGLVTKPEDWEFSSFRDYFLNRKDGFVNKESAVKFAIYSPGDCGHVLTG
jgi:putative transposase